MADISNDELLHLARLRYKVDNAATAGRIDTMSTGAGVLIIDRVLSYLGYDWDIYRRRYRKKDETVH